MKKTIIKISTIFGFATIVLQSCGPKDNPPLVYFPDMYFPVAYDPLSKAQDAYSDHENEIPAFVKANGSTALFPVDGTVFQNKDGVIQENNSRVLTPDEYNAAYIASKSILTSPLDPANQKKDLARGKVLFDQTCAACHGTAGDGQGSIVTSGAYSGVPKYSEREITVGSVQFVIMNGRNAMGSYAGQLSPGDRWRVASYIMKTFKGATATPTAVISTPAKTDSTATKK